MWKCREFPSCRVFFFDALWCLFVDWLIIVADTLSWSLSAPRQRFLRISDLYCPRHLSAFVWSQSNTQYWCKNFVLRHMTSSGNYRLFQIKVYYVRVTISTALNELTAILRQMTCVIDLSNQWLFLPWQIQHGWLWWDSLCQKGPSSLCPSHTGKHRGCRPQTIWRKTIRNDLMSPLKTRYSLLKNKVKPQPHV